MTMLSGGGVCSMSMGALIPDDRYRADREAEYPVVVHLAGRLTVFPSNRVQCTAKTRKGNRCAATAEEFTYWMPGIEIFRQGDQVFQVLLYNPGRTVDDQDLLRQLCFTHLRMGDPPLDTDPEWHWFDPSRDADLIVPSWSGSTSMDTHALLGAFDAGVDGWVSALESGVSDPEEFARAVATAVEEHLSVWLKGNRNGGV